ncbi:ribosome-associated translation inhibitor RaiA [Candidatus Falkowbacteria bacterium]|nr:ribosome-associated translation inhibitor RaiA [Candidatus Falkowbacteria bacterium]
MKLKIKATNITLTPQLKAYVEHKATMLAKYYVGIIGIEAEVDLTSHHHRQGKIYRAEFNVAVPGKLLRVEKTAEDIFKAVDKVKEHMALELKKYKEKLIDKRRRVKK